MSGKFIITLATEDGRAYYNGYAWDDRPAKAKKFPSSGHAKAFIKDEDLASSDDPFHTVSIKEI